MFNAELDTVDAPPPFESAVVNQIERPKPSYFFQKVDLDGYEVGEPFATSEREAALILENKDAFGGRCTHRYLGFSDGTTYARILREAGLRKGKQLPIREAQALLHRAFAAELEVAKGNKQRPPNVHVHLDASVLRAPGGAASVLGSLPG